MIRLHITVEGQTEQGFVKNVLIEHLAAFRVFADARCVLTSKDNRIGRTHRGGLLSYERARNDIQTWMKEDTDPKCHFTTMFDLYGLPRTFPGMEAAHRDPYDRVAALEAAFARDIGHPRFIPYIQLHEFEALILAAPQCLDSEYLEHAAPIRGLVAMANGQNPELINDGPETAPSKRIIREIPEYGGDKTAGASVVARIGLPTLRARCRHFDAWVTKLEGLAGAEGADGGDSEAAES